MSSKEPDVWFRFVRAHRTVIREIERRLAAADAVVFNGTDNTLLQLERDVRALATSFGL